MTAVLPPPCFDASTTAGDIMRCISPNPVPLDTSSTLTRINSRAALHLLSVATFPILIDLPTSLSGKARLRRPCRDEEVTLESKTREMYDMLAALVFEPCSVVLMDANLSGSHYSAVGRDAGCDRGKSPHRKNNSSGRCTQQQVASPTFVYCYTTAGKPHSPNRTMIVDTCLCPRRYSAEFTLFCYTTDQAIYLHTGRQRKSGLEEKPPTFQRPMPTFG